jgi:FtsP/CotA-like multicopper oxidase with cupredoxin domain
MLRRAVLTALLAVVVVATPLRAPVPAGALLAPASSGLTPATDENREPDIVEVRLEAKEATADLVPGKRTKVWAYNGVVPGPLITANVDDTVIVHLENRLPEPTTIHWHGVEVPAPMDGSNTSQEPVPPGGRFRYEFRVINAATYWYHSHVAGSEQVEQGLYGALVVGDPDEDRRLGLPDDEVTLLLDDVLLDDRGGFPPFASDPSSALSPQERARQLADGREGNHLLVNGRESRILDVVAGRPQRWRLVNVANGRFMRLSVPGQTLYRIGGDAGLIEHPATVRPVRMVPDPADPTRRISESDPDSGLLLVPGERAEVVIVPQGEPGDEIVVQWHDFPRGRHEVLSEPDGALAYGHNVNDGKAEPRPLLRLRVTGRAEQPSRYAPPSRLREARPLDTGEAPVLQVPFGHTEPDRSGNVVFFNALRGEDPVPFEEMTPDDAPDVVVGRTYVLEAVNLTKMDHPLHVHGFFFQPLEVEFFDPANAASNRVVPFLQRENKDTIRLPAAPGAHEGSGGKTILRVAIRFDDSDRKDTVEAFGKVPRKGRSGGWTVHCHNLEHQDQGMMSFLELRYEKK